MQTGFEFGLPCPLPLTIILCTCLYICVCLYIYIYIYIYIYKHSLLSFAFAASYSQAVNSDYSPLFGIYLLSVLSDLLFSLKESKGFLFFLWPWNLAKHSMLFSSIISLALHTFYMKHIYHFLWKNICQTFL